MPYTTSAGQPYVPYLSRRRLDRIRAIGPQSELEQRYVAEQDPVFAETFYGNLARDKKAVMRQAEARAASPIASPRGDAADYSRTGMGPQRDPGEIARIQSGRQETLRRATAQGQQAVASLSRARQAGELGVAPMALDETQRAIAQQQMEQKIMQDLAAADVNLKRGQSFEAFGKGVLGIGGGIGGALGGGADLMRAWNEPGIKKSELAMKGAEARDRYEATKREQAHEIEKSKIAAGTRQGQYPTPRQEAGTQLAAKIMGSDLSEAEKEAQLAKLPELLDRLFPTTATEATTVVPGGDPSLTRTPSGTPQAVSRMTLEESKARNVELQKEIETNARAPVQAVEDAQAKASQPLPKDRSQLVGGTYYMTARGPAWWNAEKQQFIQ